MRDQLSSDLASLKIDREENPDRKGPLRYLVWLGVLVGAGLLVYFVVLPRVGAKLFKTEIEVTELTIVSPAQGSVELTSTGYVVPQTVSTVMPKIPGRIAKVHFTEGQTVKEGDLLMELEASDLEAQLSVLRSRVAASRARAQQARAQLAEARLQARRERTLADKGVSAQAAAEDLEARVASLEELVNAADAETRATQAEVDALAVNLGYTSVTAPIGGTIISKPPEPGELVGPYQGPVLGGIELADFSTLAVETDIPEGRLHLVKMGSPTEIVLDAFPGKRYRGEVYEVSPRVNRAKATVTVKVKFVDPPEGVLPDMSARVSILDKAIGDDAVKEPPRLVVPEGAVVERNGSRVVFVVEGDRVRMTPITVGEPFGAGFEVKSGPPAGTRVVKNPPPDLADGQRVKERNEA